MTLQATVSLRSLRCISEGGIFAENKVEPYIWAFLAGVAKGPASFETTPEAALLGAARKVIKSSMTVGDSAALDFPGNILSLPFQDGQTECTLLLVVALLEADENSATEMQAGYQAFIDELKSQLGHNILALQSATPDELTILVDQIKTAVSNKAHAAVEDSMSGFEKFQVFIGSMDPDDFVASAFMQFPAVEAMTSAAAFTMQLVGTPGAPQLVNTRQYELDGDVTAVPVQADQCQAEMDGVAAAEQALRGLQGQVQALQEQLHHATPQQKPGIIQAIRQINEQQVPAAEAALGRAQEALEHCRIFGHITAPLDHPVAVG